MAYSKIKTRVVGPPEASRIYAYLGVALNECNQNFFQNLNSFSGILNGLKIETEEIENYDPSIVNIMVLHKVLDYMLISHLEASDEDLNNLLQDQISRLELKVDSGIYKNSVQYSNTIANDIIEWANGDNYLETRDEFYNSPSRDINIAFWDPTNFGVDPLEPYWPLLRPFTTEKLSCNVELQHPFSESADSPFYNQAETVYNTDNNLSEEQKDIALFWADCPGETATPAGHWMFVIDQICEQNNLSFETKVKLLSLTGIGMADAFIQCWKTKYDINLLRPKTYIREYIADDSWEPLVITPPFPEYTSGHSVISTCASRIIYEIVGDISYEDNTHARIGLQKRTFKNVLEAAKEARDSRLYGGMHYPMANQKGYEQGDCVADHVIDKLKDYI